MDEATQLSSGEGALEGTSGDVEASAGTTLAPGDHLRRYTVLGVLGEGGMGVVYDAYDPELERRVAIKVLRLPAQAVQAGLAQQAKQRLLREAQALAQLSHPNVIPIFDIGEVDGALFLAMERLEGSTLTQWLADNAASHRSFWQARVDILMAAGRGLVAAHRADLIHRDFKPDNVFVTTDGRVLVLDFGLVRPDTDADSEDVEIAGRADGQASMGLEVASDLTQVGDVMGTPQYMAPEQHRGQAADARSDQFAFCVSLFQALYGVRPYEAKHGAELVERVCAGQWQLPPGRSGVPAWLQALVVRGLSVRPQARHRSMTELLAALERGRRVKPWVLGPWLAPVGSLFLSTLALSWAVERPPGNCEGGPALFDGHGQEDTQNALEAAFAGLDDARAKNVWVEVESGLNDFRGRWLDHHHRFCSDAREDPQLSGEALDVRMACLEASRAQFVGLTHELLALDDAVLHRAAKAVRTLPSPSACADWRAHRDQSRLPQSPELRARVVELREELSRIAAAMALGRYRQGDAQLEQVLSAIEDTEFAPLRAEAYRALGAAKAKLHRGDEALEWQRKALLLAVAHDHERIAAEAAFFSIVGLGHLKGNLAAAADLIRIADSRLERTGRPPELEARLLSAKAIMAGLMGDYEISESLLLEELELRREIMAIDHPDLAFPLGNLAVTYHFMNRQDLAIPAVREGIALTERHLGAYHPKLLSSYGNLGSYLSEEGRIPEALVAYERSLAICERNFGRKHANCGYSLNGVASMQAKLGRFDAAVELWRVVAELQHERGERLGHGLPLGDRMIAQVYLDMEHLADASKAIERALRLTAAETSIQWKMRVRTWEVAGSIDLAAGRLDAAQAHLDRILAAYRSVDRLRGASPWAAMSLSAGLDLARGRTQRAVEGYRERLQATTRMYDPEHYSLSKDLLALARALREAGQSREAASALSRALRLRGAGLGMDSPRMAELHIEQAHVQIDLGEVESARRSLMQALKLQAEHGAELSTARSAALDFVRARLEWAEAEPGSRASALAVARRARRAWRVERSDSALELTRLRAFMAQLGQRNP